MTPSPVERKTIQLTTRAGAISLSLWQRVAAGDRGLLYLHGLGSTKEDFSDAVRYPVFDTLSLAALDFPGCGQSTYPADGDLGLPDLVDIADQVLATVGCSHVILAGHSLGGLVALLLSRQRLRSAHVIGFINVEGNLAPEDCFFSRLVTTAGHYDSAESFMRVFRSHLLDCDRIGYEAYAAGLPAKIQARAAIAYFKSILAQTDGSPLLEWFVALAVPRLFVYGDQNEGLTYLPRLQDAGVHLAKIPCSSHFPAMSNSTAFFSALGSFAKSIG